MPKRRLGFPILRKYIDVDRQAITSLDVLQEKSISEIDYRQRCVSIFSDKMDMTYDHEYEHDDHDNTTLHYTPTTTRPHNKVWRSATDATHCLGIGSTPVGPGKDTHGTQGPVRGEAVGGATTALRRDWTRPQRHDRA